MLAIDVITIFPRMLEGFLAESMMKRAASAGAASFRTIDPRDFTTDVHRTVDDRPYGGGPGMVMKPEPLAAAIESVLTPHSRLLIMAPQGVPFRQPLAAQLAAQARHLIFVCGHYEGIDDRIRQHFHAQEISIGDYILTNGVLPAAVVIDAVVRLLPGVLGCETSAEQESFSHGLLEAPQFTRPETFRGLDIPPVLKSGNHEAIRTWRQRQALDLTRARRPDLLHSPNSLLDE
ncbi:MAG TPA: tRNA (guanosine(37)-N1)-methyltransferase TrmD [Kiritimatiellia bacterium]|nr:tRNA (guanosine(37)-N1)-methyltransferase TrmD [Kiritimatiellia bacterium]